MTARKSSALWHEFTPRAIDPPIKDDRALSELAGFELGLAGERQVTDLLLSARAYCKGLARVPSTGPAGRAGTEGRGRPLVSLIGECGSAADFP